MDVEEVLVAGEGVLAVAEHVVEHRLDVIDVNRVDLIGRIAIAEKDHVDSVRGRSIVDQRIIVAVPVAVAGRHDVAVAGRHDVAVPGRHDVAVAGRHDHDMVIDRFLDRQTGIGQTGIGQTGKDRQKLPCLERFEHQSPRCRHG